MLITIAEARVRQENWKKLRDTFDKADSFPEGLVKTFLVQDIKNRESWKIITLWENGELLNKMRNSGKIPEAILIFRAAETDPEVTVFEVVLEKME